MGLLDTVLSSLMGGAGGSNPMRGVLMNMLGGGQAQQGGAAQQGMSMQNSEMGGTTGGP